MCLCRCGCVTQSNNGERVFAIIAVTVGATVFGFIIGSVTALVARMSDSSDRYEVRLKEVAEYLKYVPHTRTHTHHAE